MRKILSKDKRETSERPLSNRGRRQRGDSVLAILVDERSGREYYVSVLDIFTIEGQTYSVMYNYEPEERRVGQEWRSR